jgi:integrase
MIVAGWSVDTEGKIAHYPSVSLLQGSYFMHICDVAGATPDTVNTSVVRTRRYLTGREVEKLIEAARKHGRYGHRDATMILIAYRHGLRASELCDLQWHQVELNAGRLHVRRSKKGTPSVHPLQGDEIRALRRLHPGCNLCVCVWALRLMGCCPGAAFFRKTQLSHSHIGNLLTDRRKVAEAPLLQKYHLVTNASQATGVYVY